MEQVNIQIPEGYVINLEKSNLEEGKIVFKKKVTPWREAAHNISGFYVTENSDIRQLGCVCNHGGNKNLFATEKQAQSMLAMAQLSQIIANDERFGGPITDKEWKDQNVCKRIIVRSGSRIAVDSCYLAYRFLAFHTMDQRDLFLKENEDLIRQYFMLDQTV